MTTSALTAPQNRRPFLSTVESILKDHPISHENVVFQDRWSLLTGSIINENIGLSFARKPGLSRQVVSHGRFHCSPKTECSHLVVSEIRPPYN